MERIGDILKRQQLEITPGRRNMQIESPVKCQSCLDGGSVHPLDEEGRPVWNAAVPCRRCSSPERLRKYLGISSMDATFKKVRKVKGIENALAAAKKITDPATTWKMLLIYGTWGNGKTHLLEAIAIELFNQGKWVNVTIFPEFIARLKGTFDRSLEHKGDESFEEMMKSLCAKPYLLLDDVGAAGSFTPWSLDQLERIILARHRENLFTVLTTNVDYAKLPRFIVSRFSDAQKARIVLNEAPDYRPQLGAE